MTAPALRRLIPLFLLLFFCCSSGSVPNRLSDLEAIGARSRALSKAYVREDVAALVSIYTEDGVAIPGGRDSVRGREALARLWAVAEGTDVTRHVSVPAAIEIDGNHAYDWGHYEGETVREGRTSTFRGTYLIVWERGQDGVWRIAVDMWARLQDRD